MPGMIFAILGVSILKLALRLVFLVLLVLAVCAVIPMFSVMLFHLLDAMSAALSGDLPGCP